LRGDPGEDEGLSMASFDIQNCAIPLSKGNPVWFSQPFELSWFALQNCQTAKAISPEMWISLNPVAAHVGHVSLPVRADSHGNIDPENGGEYDKAFA